MTLGEGPVQELNNTAITAQAKYSIKFTESKNIYFDNVMIMV